MSSPVSSPSTSPSLQAPLRRNLSTPAGQISALSWGDPPPQFTFLHGAGLNAHTWDETLTALSLPAVALDLPGHGDSSWREDADYRPETLAETVSHALSSLTDRPQILIGQSLGGLTAIAVAALRPDLVSRLILVDVTPGLRSTPGKPNQVRDFLAGPKDFASREEIVERALQYGYGPTRAAVERGVALNTRLTPEGRVVFKHHLANLREDQRIPPAEFTALWSALENLQVPVLLVAGAHGFLKGADLQEFLERVPRSTLIETATGHNVQEDAPEVLAGIIRQFAEAS